MKKENVLRIAGIAGVVIGSGCFYFAGNSESEVTNLVGVVFVILGVIMSFFKPKKE